MILLMHLCDQSTTHRWRTCIGFTQIAKQGGGAGIMHPSLSIGAILSLVLQGLIQVVIVILQGGYIDIVSRSSRFVLILEMLLELAVLNPLE